MAGFSVRSFINPVSLRSMDQKFYFSIKTNCKNFPNLNLSPVVSEPKKNSVLCK